MMCACADKWDDIVDKRLGRPWKMPDSKNNDFTSGAYPPSAHPECNKYTEIIRGRYLYLKWLIMI